MLASNFNRFAGPNNKLLDLCNYLFSKLNVDLVLMTHNTEIERSFSKYIKFPILKVLLGSSPTPVTRLTFAPLNAMIIRRIRRYLALSTSRIFVNTSIDTLFEAYWATQTKLITGHNVLLNNQESPLFNIMDHIAAKYIIKRIIANTQFQKRQYIKIGIKEEEIQVIPTCIDMNRIETIINQSVTENFPEWAEIPVIFYGGRLTVEKGIKNLVFCYERLSQKIPATLMLMGDGPLKEWIIEKKKIIEQCNKNSKIIISEGWQPPEILLPHMKAADIVVLPSYREWCPVILLEAMSLKKAVIATRVGGIPETIKDRVNGILINPHSRKELETTLLELISDSNFRDYLGSNAFQTIRKKNDVSVVAPKFHRFLDENA